MLYRVRLLDAMAIELAHLLRIYREAGLTLSVQELGEAGVALITAGALPRTLRRDIDQLSPKRLIYPELKEFVECLPQDDPTAIIFADPVFQTVRLIRDPKLDPEQTHEIDALGIPRFTRDILVRHGFSSFADIKRIADLGLLSYVYRLDEPMAAFIIEQLPQESPQIPPQSHENRRSARRRTTKSS